MILFSTILNINDTLTPEKFVELLVEWNQNSPHKDNIIRNIDWDGDSVYNHWRDVNAENNVQLELHTHYMYDENGYEPIVDDFDYSNYKVSMARYRKIEANGTTWTTDYVVNFLEKKISIQLDRTYSESALGINANFSTPYFISELIKHDYLADDGLLKVSDKPEIINKDNLQILVDIINGNSTYYLPIVYISKTKDDEYPLDISTLSYRLKGTAHVLAADNNHIDSKLKKLCDKKNERNGFIGIYFPNSSHKQFAYRKDNEKKLLKKVVHFVIQYSNEKEIRPCYTFNGISEIESHIWWNYDRHCYENRLLELDNKTAALENANQYISYQDQMLNEANQSIKEAQKTISKNNDDAKFNGDYIKELEKENTDLQDKLKDLQAKLDDQYKETQKYKNESQRLTNRINSQQEPTLLHYGDEYDFFADEIKEIILDALSQLVSNDSDTDKKRREDIIKDIISNNDFKGIINERRKKVKTIIKGIKKLDPSTKQDLKEIGINVNNNGTHNHLSYYNDDRYMVPMAKTASDNRNGKNIASEINEHFL